MDNGLVHDSSGRKYRSKKQRPCDLCRSRKTQCKIQQDADTCELCRRLNHPCTFVLHPLKKDRNLPQPDGAAPQSSYAAIRPQAGQTEGQVDADATVQMPRLDSNENVDTPTALSSSLSWSRNLDEYGLTPAAHEMPVNWSSMDFSFDHGLSSPDGAHVNQLGASNDGTCPGGGVPSNGDASTPVTTASIQLSTEGGGPGGEPAAFDPSMDSFIQDLFSSRSNSLQDFDWPVDFSLESKLGYSNQLIGLSGESDPYLLQYYFYNVHDTHTMFKLDFRRMQSVGETMRSGEPQVPVGDIPVQFVMTSEKTAQDEPKPMPDTLLGVAEEDDRRLLDKLVPSDVGYRLVALYLRFVHPRFPVLSIADLLPDGEGNCGSCCVIGIRAAVFALSLPFVYLDDELSVSTGYLHMSTADFWAVAHRSYLRSAHLSHLWSLQLCLLLLQMPPRNPALADPPSSWALSCSALALSESLGIHLEASSWRLPRKEISLRRRLWWLTYNQHAWQAILLGRPSHLNSNSWDVTHLTDRDFELDQSPDAETRKRIEMQIPIIIDLCDLSEFAGRISDDLYSVKATRECSTFETTIGRAEPLLARLDNAQQTVTNLSASVNTLDDGDLEQTAALRLSHCTLRILIYRALLRHLPYHALPSRNSQQKLISSIHENSYLCTKGGIELLNALKSRHFATFWPQYTRYQICYISSLILLNFAQSPTRDMALENKALLGDWRDALRAQARSWPLAKLATMRIDAVFWKGLSAVIYGTGSDSPAHAVLKEHGPHGSNEDGSHH